MKLFFFGAALSVLLQGCGARDTEYVYDNQKPVAYTFSEIKAVCSKCHPGAGPAIPLGDETSFKGSAKVKSEIESGDMPPPAAKIDFDKTRALEFFK